MKSKKLQTPFLLRKETIANLSKDAKAKVKGGACTLEDSGCNTLVCCSYDLLFSCSLPPFCVGK